MRAYIAFANLNNALRGDDEKALADLDKAIALGLRLPNPYVIRGNVLLRRGNWEKALADFSKAVEVDPRYPNAYLGRAKVRFLNEDYANAWADVKKCHELGGELDEDFLDSLREASGRDELPSADTQPDTLEKVYENRL